MTTVSGADEAGHRMALAREWDDLVGRIRRLDGFEDFLRPPDVADLLKAAASGPVVVVNLSSSRCDALVVTESGVDVVELHTLSLDDVERRVERFLRVLRDGVSVVAGAGFAAALAERARQRREREEVLRSTMEWLWDVLVEPVLRALDITVAQSVSPQRIWWCPTGLLTLLPLHGAGYHDAAEGNTTLDRVVSSYTPSLRALIHQRGSVHDAGNATQRLLFVGADEVPDQLELAEEVAREKELLSGLLPGGITPLDGADATVERVQRALTAHRWAHLSCHGHQKLDNPSAAGFMLNDGTLTVTRLARMTYPGEFAFLSACRTATGGIQLPDEAITLAAALSYTGFRHVVATLWSVDPATAADVTAGVYPRLIYAGRFVPDRSAHALHETVTELRANGRPLDDWLPFTHTGP
ncbi:CHAT domain-containing protein [Nocardia brasiliensis]|uniref:CHAT domain-containing protein n=1 Tax=Nocardia brasiliensis TaxID=37326 RepID=UPI002454EA42|nr:CHAT domain-containing protein [Nocardia brasiliensis]